MPRRDEVSRRKNYNPLLKSYPDSVLINSVSEGAEVLYVRLVAQSDDAGRYWGNATLVAAKLFSHRFAAGQVSVEDVDKRISELIIAGLISIYTISGQDYLVMTGVYKQLRGGYPPVVSFPGPSEGSFARLCRPIGVILGVRGSTAAPTQPNPHQPNPTQPNKKGRRLDYQELLLREFPDVASGSGFLKVWVSWVRYRSEIGKSLKPTTARSQLSLARRVGPVSFMRAVEASIEAGWTGLFPKDEAGDGAPRAAGAIESFLDSGTDPRTPRVVGHAAEPPTE